MLGRVHGKDRAAGVKDRPGYDALGKFGAGTQYEVGVKLKHLEASADASKTLWASNKPSEHNISNMLPRIVVAQLAAQTQSRAVKTMISRRIILRPGNQSLGGT